jgi:arylsulfatase A-like enzyme
VSFLPVVRGETGAVRDHLVAEITYHAAYDPARCIRTDRYKYVRCFADLPQMVLPNVDDSYSKTVLTDAGLPSGPRPREMLFDLVADPQEFENLAARDEYADTRRDLAARLQNWMEQTQDPILSGDVPLPPGAHVTPPDQYDPKLPKE